MIHRINYDLSIIRLLNYNRQLLLLLIILPSLSLAESVAASKSNPSPLLTLQIKWIELSSSTNQTRILAASASKNDIEPNFGEAPKKLFSLKIGNRAQFLFHGRYINNKNSHDIIVDHFDIQHSGYFLGSRLKLAGFKGSIMLEMSYWNLEFSDNRKDDYFKTLLGIHYKLRKKVWLRMAIENVTGRELPGLEEPVLSANLLWIDGEF